MIELGYADVEYYIWAGLFAPKGTPAPVVNRLRDAMREVMTNPQVTADLREGRQPGGLPGSAGICRLCRGRCQAAHSCGQENRQTGREKMKIGLFDHVEHGGSPNGDAVRRAAHLRPGRRRSRLLLPACGRASRHAAQHGAGAGRLSRRGGARDQADAARAAGLSAAALFAAAADRGNLHARSPEPRPARGRRRPRRLAVRAEISQGRARGLARDLHRRLQVRQRRPDHRRAHLFGSALQIRERADRAATAAEAASGVLVRLVQHHRLDLGGRARHAFRQPRPDAVRQDQHRRLPGGARQARRRRRSRRPNSRAAPSIGVQRHIFVDDTDEEAKRFGQAGDGIAPGAAQLASRPSTASPA